MAIEIYLNFDGNCREAVEFYAKVFGSDLQPMMTYGEAHTDPEDQIPPEAKNRIMHTFLMIGGSRVMFADAFPGEPYIAGNNFSMTFLSKDAEEFKSVFNRLKEGGTVDMELQKTFWSDCYGAVTDKFGISWQVSQESTALKS